MRQRQIEGLIIGCLGVFMALFFVVYIDYVKQMMKSNYIEHDVKTITAGDYSVEFDIPEKLYKTFLSTEYNPLTGQTKAAAFRDYLQTQFEQRLSSLPN
jgi:hypothetical protein